MRNIVIIGAGPTGLACALELARRGIACRIIDRKAAQSTLSRAVGINPHSLDLLEASGVTPLLLQHGIKMYQARFHDQNGKTLAVMRIDQIRHRYNFMLALPQDETERIMQERLANYGIAVEYGTELAAIRLEGDKAALTLSRNMVSEQVTADIVIAADGSNSRVRQSLDIPFIGYEYEKPWSIADIESLDMPYDAHEAHAFVLGGGKIGVAIAIGKHRYRLVASDEYAEQLIPGTFTISQTLAANNFHIHVRQAETYQMGPVFLAGDAAHVHSPVGGRGMNLGIDDAADLAHRIAENDLKGYTATRHPIGKKTIRLTERLATFMTTRHPLLLVLRNIVLRVLTAIPVLQRPIAMRMAGLM